MASKYCVEQLSTRSSKWFTSDSFVGSGGFSDEDKRRSRCRYAGWDENGLGIIEVALLALG